MNPYQITWIMVRERGRHKKVTSPNVHDHRECWEVYFWEVQPRLPRWLFSVQQLISDLNGAEQFSKHHPRPTAAGRCDFSTSEQWPSGTKSWFSLVFVVPAKKIIWDGMHMAPRIAAGGMPVIWSKSALQTARAHIFLNRSPDWNSYARSLTHFS